MPQNLESCLPGKWARGEGVDTTLVDPVTGEALATASVRGLDLAGTLWLYQERLAIQGGKPKLKQW
jgi:hypothetical protein